MPLYPPFAVPLVVFAIVAFPALAQSPSPAPGEMPVIPQPKCVAPEYPGRDASKSRVDAFNTDYKAYGECMKKYVDDTNKWIKGASESANKAIDAYNKYTEELRKKIDADK